MSEQKPLQKPIAHHLGPKIPNRPISSGYELKSEISPELQRNIPSVIPEATKNEKNEKEEKSRKDKLNINAPSFHPKSKPNYANTGSNFRFFIESSNSTYKNLEINIIKI